MKAGTAQRQGPLHSCRGGSREIGSLTSVGEGLRAQAGKDRRLSERKVLSLLPGTEVRCGKNFIINNGRVLHAMVRYIAYK